jgi:hypothetical protein
MSWTEDVALVAMAGAASYFLYLLFLLVVLIRDGTAGVEKVAKVVPAPRWIEAVASAVAAFARRQSDTNLPDLTTADIHSTEDDQTPIETDPLS